MERQMLDIRRTDTWRNERIRATTKVIDIDKSIKCTKRMLAGHIARLNETDERPPLTGVPEIDEEEEADVK